MFVITNLPTFPWQLGHLNAHANQTIARIPSNKANSAREPLSIIESIIGSHSLYAKVSRKIIATNINMKRTNSLTFHSCFVLENQVFCNIALMVNSGCAVKSCFLRFL